MTDLFGNVRPERASSAAPASVTNLFDFAAEKAARASGRPLSQERTEIVSPPCTCGHPTGDHGPDGCHYPEPDTTRLAFCPCEKPGPAESRTSMLLGIADAISPRKKV